MPSDIEVVASPTSWNSSTGSVLFKANLTARTGTTSASTHLGDHLRPGRGARARQRVRPVVLRADGRPDHPLLPRGPRHRGHAGHPDARHRRVLDDPDARPVAHRLVGAVHGRPAGRRRHDGRARVRVGVDAHQREVAAERGRAPARIPGRQGDRRRPAEPDRGARRRQAGRPELRHRGGPDERRQRLHVRPAARLDVRHRHPAGRDPADRADLDRVGAGRVRLAVLPDVQALHAAVDRASTASRGPASCRSG